MISICHVIQDAKFVDHMIAIFQSPLFANSWIFIGDRESYKGENINSIQFFDREVSHMNHVVKTVEKSDVVIVSRLDYIASFIVNRLPDTVKKIWFFYGAEIYHRPEIHLNYLSSKTKESLRIGKYNKTKTIVLNILRTIKWGARLKLAAHVEFDRAIKNLDYFFWYDEDEYANLSGSWKKLPPFIELSAMRLAGVPFVIDAKKNRATSDGYIVVGNSRAPENNSLDIIDVFNSLLTSGRPSLLFPLSYGPEGKYYDVLMGRIKSSHLAIEVMDEFVSYESYVKKLAGAKAAVLNSFRPMGGGNTLIYLANGVKLYLSERNSFYKWLQKKGFIISSIEADLKSDIANDALSLHPDQAEHNISQFKHLSDERSMTAFHESFYNTLKGASKS